jgi:hypothetical protein
MFQILHQSVFFCFFKYSIRNVVVCFSVKKFMSKWNVNNWHWEERPMTGYSKERIPELLGQIEVFF